MTRWQAVSAAASLGLTALVIVALAMMMWQSAAVSSPRNLSPTTQPPTVTATVSPKVAAMGTRFPTNVPHSPPTPTPTPTVAATATPVILQDTLISTPAPPPAVGITVEPVGVESNRFILVNQDEQMMHIFENGREVRKIPVSTGRPVTNAFTPPWRGAVGEDWGSGAFRGSGLYSDFMWFLFPGPEGSILIHSVPYTKNGAEKQYDRLDALGVEPTSKGCVRISPEDAAWFKQWNPVGVPIEITRWSGKIQSPQ